MDFQKAEFLRLSSNLKPALAGLVIDHTVGQKEIVGTVVDLIIRGYIGYQNRILWPIKRDLSPLLFYEREIIKEIFKGRNEVSEEELLKFVSKKINYELLQTLVINEAVRQGLYTGKHKGALSLKVSQFFHFCMPHIKAIIFILGLGTLSIILVSNISGQSPFFCCQLTFLLLFALIILLGASISFFFRARRKSGIERTEFGRSLSKKYIELYEYMKKYPLKEGRLFNEYIPYAIAFGLDRSWLRKFGTFEHLHEVRK